jgi:hypothetical protein
VTSSFQFRASMWKTSIGNHVYSVLLGSLFECFPHHSCGFPNFSCQSCGEAPRVETAGSSLPLGSPRDSQPKTDKSTFSSFMTNKLVYSGRL